MRAGPETLLNFTPFVESRGSLHTSTVQPTWLLPSVEPPPCEQWMTNGRSWWKSHWFESRTLFISATILFASTGLVFFKCQVKWRLRGFTWAEVGLASMVRDLLPSPFALTCNSEFESLHVSVVEDFPEEFFKVSALLFDLLWWCLG